MNTVSRNTYDALSEELGGDLRRTVEAFGARHGRSYDPDAYRTQTDANDNIKQILGFGLDIWPHDEDEGGGETMQEPVVIPMPLAGRRPVAPLLMAIAAAMVLLILPQVEIVSDSQASHRTLGAQHLALDTVITVTTPTPFVADDVG